MVAAALHGSRAKAQSGQIFPAQSELNALQPDGEYDNVTNKKIYSDSLTTSFVIWVKKDVPLHKHAFHTEQILVLEGTAQMRIGEVWFDIKPGDWLTVPKNTPHAVKVTSAVPLKVLSIQSPEFKGDDRILLKE